MQCRNIWFTLPPPTPEVCADIGVKRVIQIYGSTETGGVGWRDQCHTEYRLEKISCSSAPISIRARVV